MEPRHTRTHTTARTHLSVGELVLFRVPLPLSRRTNQNRTIDSGWDKGFWCGRLAEDNAHIIVTENGREIARTVRRLPLNQHVDVSLLKRVKGLPWDGQRLGRRSRLPKLVFPEPSMAATGETLRTGGSSSSGTRSSPIRPGPTDVKVDAETAWTPATGLTFRSKTPHPAVVEETKRLRSKGPTSDTGDNTKMELMDEETWKRVLVELIGDDDDELAGKYWRAEDFVAKALMGELIGNRLTDENGILDEDAAGDTLTDYLGGRRRARQAGSC